MSHSDSGASGSPRGATLGRYVILEQVGEGSTGAVYAAYDPQLDRRVALKVLRRGTDGQDQARLLREAQAMARLSHPNVVGVHDAGEVGGELYIAMEYVEGKTLRGWLEERGRTWREVVEVYRQAGRGLSAAHGAGIVHRDFKPENVLIDAGGRVRVTDFGLARAGRGEGGAPGQGPVSEGLTLTGSVHGTPGYMAPEQFRGEATDARTDQFGFCCALHEGLYGERPFAGESLEALAFTVCEGKVRPAPEGSSVPRWVRQAVMRGLAADPSDRYGSMEELLAALGRDPAARARRWGIAGLTAAALAGLAVTSGLLVATARERARQICSGGEQKLTGVWDAERREQIRRAFLGTAAPYAADAWRGVERTLDGYARDWVAMHRDACEATQVRKEQSQALLDLRMECLERRRVELRALTQVLAAADAKVVENAAQAVAGQDPVQICADTAALTSLDVLPTQPDLRAKIEAVRGEVVAVEALRLAGKLMEARQRGERAVDAARALGRPATLAEALVALGVVQVWLNEPQAAEVVLREGVGASIEGHDGELLANALMRLAHVVGTGQSRMEEGVRLARWSRAAVEALGPGHDALEPEQLMMEAGLADARGDLAEARRLDEAALALLERSQRGESLTTATHLVNLGRDYANLGDFERAARMDRRAAAILERVAGAAHPRYARALHGEAVDLLGAGRSGEALPLLERSRSILAAATGPESVMLGQVTRDLGTALLDAGRLDEALAMGQQAVAIAGGSAAPNRDLAVALTSLAEIHLRRGEHAKAVDAARRGAARYAALFGRDYMFRSAPLVIEAQALMVGGEPRRALAAGEEALAILEKAGAVASSEKADAQLVVAQALVATGGARERALELARSARDLYRRQGGGYERKAADAEAWLVRLAPR